MTPHSGKEQCCRSESEAALRVPTTSSVSRSGLSGLVWSSLVCLSPRAP